LKGDEEAEKLKKVRNLENKLKQVQELKEKQLAGHTLELNQIQKIEKEATLLEELAQLSVKIDPSLP
jgi:translation initiation factor 2A